MSISWLLTNFLATFLLPPANGLLFAALGLLLWNRRPQLARGLVGFGLMLLVVLALPATGDALLRSLESKPAGAADRKLAQAIVVLGGGRHRDALEYAGDTVGPATLVRIRYAAKLSRETRLPLLVSGGKPDGGQISEAEAMRLTLVQEFGVSVRWVEGESGNTRENARRSAALLRADGVTRILLVTHAWHMPRAMGAFSDAGLAVSPAPTSFHREPLTPLDFLPRAAGLESSSRALREWIGLLWYSWHG